MANANAIAALLIVLLLGFLIYGPWQEICTDFARQLIFEKRDAIFDIADKGELTFNSQDYRIIRSGLEKLIRFAHELTLPSLVFIWIFIGIKPNERPDLLLAIDRITDKETNEKVRGLVDEALMVAALMVVLKSPITMVALLPIVALGACWATIRSCGNRLLNRSKIAIQFEAERVGTLEDATAA
jgi:hypothetical protein